MKIRLADRADAAAILQIYTPYVLHTNVTFEYQVPSLEEFADRIDSILQKYPYFVAEEDGALTGYAYASAFKDRAAYDWSVETSIYVDQTKQHRGTGKALYQALEDCLKELNICNLCACIAYPNPQSISFHESFGYKLVAHFTASGYKAGVWSDMVWMEKALNEHLIPPKPFIPLPDYLLKHPIFNGRKEQL